MLTFRTQYNRPGNVGQRSWRAIARSGMLAVGVAWDRLFKMRHFEPAGAVLYKYAFRTAAYLRRRKLKRGIPENVPLRYTGATLAAVRARQIPRPFPSRVTIDLPVASYVSMRPAPVGRTIRNPDGTTRVANRQGPALGEELTRLVPDELADLEQVFVEATEPQIAALLEEAFSWGR